MAHDLVTELLQYSSLACFMPIWQLCANLLIPNCLRSNLSYSLLAALELYVKKPNSPFCAPQLILFQKRKHRVKEKKTQHLIQYSVIQFFFKGLLFTPLKSKVYILSIYLYIYNIIIKNTLQNNQSLSSGFSNPLSM